MIATLMMLQAAAVPAAAGCTPALVAKATPPGWAVGATVAYGGWLVPGRAASVTLATGARFAVAPEKPAPAGASVSFDVPRAGRWQVSLDQGAWIDVIRGGAAVRSVAHGHGAASPACESRSISISRPDATSSSFPACRLRA